ncbi:hypothetical protein LTR28_004593 [Elasticomyces elasticus]|nr:hypothetical protein LTR28_004593 [Elasticomyces elasticus]
MATDYFTDYQSFIATKSLPSPADTPYSEYIPRSRHSSRSRASPRGPSSSPPPLPPDGPEHYQARPRDGKLTGLDPRRFTPTLHASLVSEILMLRRELDSKHVFIENLEHTLQDAKTENHSLNGQLLQSSKESKSAQRQLQHVERGTLNAVEELLKERDTAKSTNDDLKIKLDSIQRKVRRQEEDALRLQSTWEMEKEGWEDERRQLERRVHITENRLRALVEELTMQPDADENMDQGAESGGEETSKDSGLGNESDAASVQSYKVRRHRRNVSSLSYRSLRRSGSKGHGSDAGGKPNGYSLADELPVDEEDENDLDDFEYGEIDNLDRDIRIRRVLESRQSSQAGELDAKAKRILGIMADQADTVDLRELFRSPPKDRRRGPVCSRNILNHPKPIYMDTGVQPSPPASPTSAGVDHIAKSSNREDHVPEHGVSPVRSSPPMVSTGSQTQDAPPSPPATPKTLADDHSEEVAVSGSTHEYCSVSTQTIDAFETSAVVSHTSLSHKTRPPSLKIPSITIHPPISAPSSPRAAVLPPGTKNAACQTELRETTSDALMQTEEIRVDQRLSRLPSRFLPTIFSASPTSPLPSPPMAHDNTLTGVGYTLTMESESSGAKNLRSLPLKAIPLPRPVLSAPPGRDSALSDNDDGPLNRATLYGVTRPIRSSSLFAGFQDDSEDDSDCQDGDVSAHRTKGLDGAVLSRRADRFNFSKAPTPVLEEKESSAEQGDALREASTSDTETAGRPGMNFTETESQAVRMPFTFLRGANSTAPHSRRGRGNFTSLHSRSPSFGSVASSSVSFQSRRPPYPIPTRSSSRAIANSQSEASHSPTPTAEPFSGRMNGSMHQYARRGSLRKVRSAVTMQQNMRTSPRRRRRDPHLTPIQSMAYDTPEPTQFPIPDLPTPLQRAEDPLRWLSGGRPGTAESSVGGAGQEINLIDAIAATMVGEWMWKYTRKRKSFGVPEATQDFHKAGMDGTVNITGSGVRHKRWVWLSPYERTVMWSGKQPTSGPALMGKNGRKLMIQSVLDVKDDTPMPRSVGLEQVFNRSILILTPTRALKFTAPNSERHYLWLAALSFLAQSADHEVEAPRMPLAPPTGQDPSRRPPAPTAIQHTPIRDAVHTTKAYPRPAPLSRLILHVEPAQNHTSISPDSDGADPPTIPRLYSGTHRHQRKRSATASHLPAPLAPFRSFSTNALVLPIHVPPSSSSIRLVQQY